MATTSSSSILQPQQQQQASAEATLTSSPQAVTSSGAWQSSGSIGPFFAVISGLTVLAILSCYLGRMWKRRAPTPLQSIKGGGCFGWLKRQCRQCITRDVEVGGNGAKVMDCKVKDGEVDPQNPPQV